MKRFITILIAALFMAAPVLADTKWRTVSGEPSDSAVGELQPGQIAFFEVNASEDVASPVIWAPNCLSVTAMIYDSGSLGQFAVYGSTDPEKTYSNQINDTLDGTAGLAFIFNITWKYIWVDTIVAAGGSDSAGIALFCTKGYK